MNGRHVFLEIELFYTFPPLRSPHTLEFMKKGQLIAFPHPREVKDARLAKLRIRARAVVNRTENEQMLKLITRFAVLSPVLAGKLLNLADKYDSLGEAGLEREFRKRVKRSLR